MTYDWLPSIDELNPKDTKYVSKLEEGLTKIENYKVPVETALESIVAGVYDEIISEARTQIPHANIIDMRMKINKLIDIEETKIIRILFDIELESRSRQYGSMIYKIINKISESYRERIESTIEKIEILEEAESIFREELLSRTEVSMISGTGDANVHLYIVNKERVYEVDVNILTGKETHHRESSIIPDDIMNIYLPEDSYIVSNPSQKLTIDELVIKSLYIILEINDINLTLETLS